MSMLRARDYILINGYAFSLSFLWNGMHTIILPAVLLEFAPTALKGTYLAVMTFVGLVLAMLIQPISGGMSDRTLLTWGRRKPWILAGAGGTLVALLLLGIAQTYLVLLLAYLLLQVMSNIAHGPMQGLIPDIVPRARRGVAAGVKNLLELTGLLIGVSVAGYFIDHGRAEWALIVIAIVLIAGLLVLLFGVREKGSKVVATAVGLWDRIKDALASAYCLDYRKYSDYAWLLVGRFLVMAGIYAVQGFGQYFVQDVLDVHNPARVTARLLTVVGLSTAVLIYPAGYASDRLGRKMWNIVAALVCGFGILLLLTVQSYQGLLLAGVVMGAGLGSFMSVNWALATDLVPASEAGKYLGLSNLATAGAAAASRMGGPLVDIFNLQGGGQGYRILFALAGLSALAGGFILWHKVREPVLATERRPPVDGQRIPDVQTFPRRIASVRTPIAPLSLHFRGFRLLLPTLFDGPIHAPAQRSRDDDGNRDAEGMQDGELPLPARPERPTADDQNTPSDPGS